MIASEPVSIEVYKCADGSIEEGTLFDSILSADKTLGTGNATKLGVRITLAALDTTFSFTLGHIRGRDFIQACIDTLLTNLQEGFTPLLLMTNNFFVYALAQEETLETMSA